MRAAIRIALVHFVIVVKCSIEAHVWKRAQYFHDSPYLCLQVFEVGSSPLETGTLGKNVDHFQRVLFGSMEAVGLVWNAVLRRTGIVL
jgi:hypothetical protein